MPEPRTHCLNGHAETVDSRYKDGKCRRCTAERQARYQKKLRDEAAKYRNEKSEIGLYKAQAELLATIQDLIARTAADRDTYIPSVAELRRGLA